jgi:hypothetical protein
MTTDPIALELIRLRRLREAAQAARDAATEALEPTIIAALTAGWRVVDIARTSEVSDSYIRGLRRKAGLPAHPSYAHLTPPGLPKDK